MTLTRALHLTVLSFMLAATAFIAWLTYMRVIDGNPPAVVTVPYATDKTAYAPGDPITLTAHVCKVARYPVTTYPSLVLLPDNAPSLPVQGTLYPLPAVASLGTPAGCGTFTVRGLYAVPKDVPPGRYVLKAVNVFHVNFLADRSLEWYTNQFEVTAP